MDFQCRLYLSFTSGANSVICLFHRIVLSISFPSDCAISFPSDCALYLFSIRLCSLPLFHRIVLSISFPSDCALCLFFSREQGKREEGEELPCVVKLSAACLFLASCELALCPIRTALEAAPALNKLATFVTKKRRSHFLVTGADKTVSARRQCNSWVGVWRP